MTERTRLTLEWLIWGAILLLFIVDRFIKQLIVNVDTIVINKSIALNISFPIELVVIITSFILLWLLREIYRAQKKKKYFSSVTLLAIFAGGLGNVIDRLYYYGVVDYITTFVWFPIFNLSDVLITLGVVGVGLYYYYESHEKRN